MRIVVWFRRDLRVHDHAALWHACNTGPDVEVIPVFVLDPAHFANPEVGSTRVRFLLECLADLDRSLLDRGSWLTLLRGRAEEALPRFVRETRADAIFYSHDIERWSGQLRDRALAATAAAEGWRFEGFLNYHLQLSGTYDRAEWQRAWTEHSKAAVHDAPAHVPTPVFELPADVPAFGYIPSLKDLGLPAAEHTAAMPGGESAGRSRMTRFLTERVETYRASISKPLLAEDDGTSRMSAYFKFGCISQREAIQTARVLWPSVSTRAQKGLEAWVSRLQWRDHFVQKFALYPQAEFVNLYAPFDDIRQPELPNTTVLDAWRHGQTGYPLVDASMRALIQTGLLNFRMRAMLATFLTLNLLQAWQHGAEWFMKHLLDGDACVDHWQWQMQAGITQPGRAYIRCYNPTKQCADNDPDAAFIHRYVPELRALPAPMVFKPWTLSELEQQLFRVRIGVDYPAPIVDADVTRQRALDLVQPIRDRLAASDNLERHLNHMRGVNTLLRLKGDGEHMTATAETEELIQHELADAAAALV
jgi:deoxyribodipyrimidine photo-lyase